MTNHKAAPTPLNPNEANMSSKPYFVWRNEPLVGAPYDYGWFSTVVYPQTGKTPMTHDPTEAIRREMIATGEPQRDLAETKERRWSTSELTRDFDVLGFAAPFVVVRHRDTGVKGSLEFTHSPRVYFNWTPDTGK
jgi:hypothetical protein